MATKTDTVTDELQNNVNELTLDGNKSNQTSVTKLITSDLEKLTEILDVVVKKYKMPEDVLKYVQKMRSHMHNISTGDSHSVRKTLDAFVELRREYLPALNRFFGWPGLTKPCPSWWKYYVVVSISLEKELNNAISNGVKAYQGANLEKEKPTDNADEVDESFEYEEKFQTVEAILNDTYIESRDPRGMKILALNIFELIDIINIILKKYPMPQDAENFIKEMREDLFQIYTGCGENSTDIHEVTERLIKVKDNYHSPLNIFFNSGDEKKSALWWGYYSRSFMNMRLRLMSLTMSGKGEYTYIPFKDTKPLDDPEAVDESFEYNKEYVIPVIDRSEIVECYSCCRQVTLENSNIPGVGLEDMYPMRVHLMDKNGIHNVPVCTPYCNKVVTQMETSYLREQGCRVQQTQKDWKLCDICFKEKEMGKKLLRCSKCRNKYYCSKQCQASDEVDHKKICKIIKERLAEHGHYV